MELNQKIIIGTCIFLIIVLFIWLIKRSPERNLYFDNNGTTMPYKEVIKSVSKAFAYGNASASYATDAKKVLLDCREKIQQWTDSNSHTGIAKPLVIFTSGASESNNLIIRSSVDKWWKNKQTKPHVIISAIEHKTSIGCCHELESLGRAECSYILPTSHGVIHPDLIKKSIRPNTCLISIMHANNELGTINDLKTISSIAHVNDITFHTDATQTFGKMPIPMANWGIDALSASFHKLHGPPGIGVLLLNPHINIPPQISGSQNYGIRGGTENIPAIAGALTAMQITQKDRASKNKKLFKMRNIIHECLIKSFNQRSLSEFTGKPDTYSPDYRNMVQKAMNQKSYNVIFLTPLGVDDSIPNTLMFSIIKDGPMADHFCNIKFKRDLMEDHAIVSIGSACNTANSAPSHVLIAIQVPYIIRCGVIRVSLSDMTTESECRKLCQKLIRNIKKQ